MSGREVVSWTWKLHGSEASGFFCLLWPFRAGSFILVPNPKINGQEGGDIVHSEGPWSYRVSNPIGQVNGYVQLSRYLYYNQHIHAARRRAYTLRIPSSHLYNTNQTSLWQPTSPIIVTTAICSFYPTQSAQIQARTKQWYHNNKTPDPEPKNERRSAVLYLLKL